MLLVLKPCVLPVWVLKKRVLVKIIKVLFVRQLQHQRRLAWHVRRDDKPVEAFLLHWEADDSLLVVFVCVNLAAARIQHLDRNRLIVISEKSTFYELPL